jgi:hypothetical protein
MAERIVSMLLPPKIGSVEIRRLSDEVRHRTKVTPPRIARIRARTSLYGVSAVDDRGRIMAQHLMAGLGWTPGTRHSLTEQAGLLVLLVSDLGELRLTAAGHVRLPATVRHWYGLEAGARVLLVADPELQRLVIHPPAAIDAMITQAYQGLMAGEAA